MTNEQYYARVQALLIVCNNFTIELAEDGMTTTARACALSVLACILVLVSKLAEVMPRPEVWGLPEDKP